MCIYSQCVTPCKHRKNRRLHPTSIVLHSFFFFFPNSPSTHSRTSHPPHRYSPQHSLVASYGHYQRDHCTYKKKMKKKLKTKRRKIFPLQNIHQSSIRTTFFILLPCSLSLSLSHTHTRTQFPVNYNMCVCVYQVQMSAVEVSAFTNPV